MTSSLRRTRLVQDTIAGGGLVLLVIVTGGCLGPSTVPSSTRDTTPRRQQAVIEAARRDMLREEREPGGDANEGPVEVLFINGDALTVDDIVKWARPKLDELAAQLSPEEYQAKSIELLRAEVRAQAERRVLSQEARRTMGAQVTERLDQFVDGRIREIVNTEHGGRESRYREWLRSRGIGVAEDRARIMRELLVVAYLQRTIGPKVVGPTRREIERFHREFVAAERDKQKRRMLLIDIPYGDEDATGRRMSPPVPLADAKSRAEQALSRLRAGEEFSNVAAQYSQGVNAYHGGDWGWVTRASVKPRWDIAVEELYRLGEQQHSDIVQTDGALFIVRCAEIEEIAVPSFEALQPRLIESFKQQQYELLARELVGELLAKADVRPENPGRFLRAVVDAAARPAAMR